MSTDWKVYTYEDISGGGTWTLDDDNLKRPNANITAELTSTHITDMLIDGDKAITELEIKGHYSPVQFLFQDDDLTIYSQFETYRQNGEYLKITTHNGSITFYGRVMSVTYEWIAGATNSSDGDLFDVMVTLDRTNTLS